MSEDTAPSALKRKAQVGLEQFQARAMTAARALRVSMAKVAEAEYSLALAVIGITEAKVPPKTVLDEVEETSLLMVLDTPGRGPAAAIVDSSFVEAMVQQQTMGRVSEVRPDAKPRKATRTDAALIGPFLDSLFARAGPMPDTAPQLQLISGLRFGAEVASTRLLAMALEAQEYIHFALTIDFDGGTRQGRMSLLIPPNDVVSDDDDPGPGEDPADTPKTLESTVMGLNAQLRVALCRLRMPFSELAALKPGDDIPLPDGVMKKTEILTIAGRKIAQGKLGQINGIRAIRMDRQSKPLGKPARRAGDAVAGQTSGRIEYDDARSSEAEADTAFQIAAQIDSAADNLPMLPGDTEVGLPDLPEMPGLAADVGDLPELAELPGGPGASEAQTDALPDLPAMPDFPDLPDLPDLKQA